MVINYKELNKYTKFDGYFLPHKDTLITSVINKKIFSKFDCKFGFWQIKLEEESIPLTAFSTPQGQYEWVVMHFGLKNAPQIFQRMMEKIFKEFHEFCIVYVDYILIFSNNKIDHVNHLISFVEKCKKHGILLSKKKTKIMKPRIEFLLLIIDETGIEMQHHISKKIYLFLDKLEI